MFYKKGSTKMVLFENEGNFFLLQLRHTVCNVLIFTCAVHCLYKVKPCYTDTKLEYSRMILLV